MLGWAAEFLSDPRTPLAFAAFVVAAAVLIRPVVRRLGWRLWPTLGALLSLAVIGTLTLPPSPGAPVLGPDWPGAADCLRGLADPGALWSGLTATRERGERLGNILMFVPAGFFFAVASRRPALTAVAGVLLPAGLELAQALLGAGRDCGADDWLNNATGALIGVAAGAGVLLLAGRAQPPGSPPPGVRGTIGRGRRPRRAGRT